MDTNINFVMLWLLVTVFKINQNCTFLSENQSTECFNFGSHYHLSNIELLYPLYVNNKMCACCWGMGSAVVREDSDRKRKCYYVCHKKKKISLIYQPYEFSWVIHT